MSVRSFHSVFMAGIVAGAALGCYLVSLRVASERAALESVEGRIVEAQADIRLLQTEIGTRGRLTQLERWNASALSLSAPAANQFLHDSFQLATMMRPEHKLDVEAPVVLASAPAQPQPSPLEDGGDGSDAAAAGPAQLIHEASLKTGAVETAPKAKAIASLQSKAAVKAAEAPKKTAPKPVKVASVDPLAPLPAAAKTKSRTSDKAQHSSKDSGRTK